MDNSSTFTYLLPVTCYSFLASSCTVYTFTTSPDTSLPLYLCAAVNISLLSLCWLALPYESNLPVWIRPPALHSVRPCGTKLLVRWQRWGEHPCLMITLACGRTQQGARDSLALTLLPLTRYRSAASWMLMIYWDSVQGERDAQQ